MCSYTMQNHGLCLCVSSASQSGSETQIQCVAMDLPHPSVAVQTGPCHYKCAVFPSDVCPSVPFLAFQPYQGHTARLCSTNRAVCRCNDPRDSVIYACATRTSFKVPKKNLGSHACTNSGYQVLLSHFSSTWEQG